MIDIEKVITTIRNSHKDIENLYLNGQCYNFYLILRSIFGPKVECWYDYEAGHIYSKIGKYWYDIKGKHLKVGDYCEPFNHKDCYDKPHRWGKRDNRRLK
jgi:hypothetical protein